MTYPKPQGKATLTFSVYGDSKIQHDWHFENANNALVRELLAGDHMVNATQHLERCYPIVCNTGTGEAIE